jgi:hypothetical protein
MAEGDMNLFLSLPSLVGKPLLTSSCLLQMIYFSLPPRNTKQRRSLLDARTRMTLSSMNSDNTKVRISQAAHKPPLPNFRLGTAHGFAARPVLSNPEVMAGYEGAFEQAVEWFNKTIPVETDISARSHAEHSVLNPEA